MGFLKRIFRQRDQEEDRSRHHSSVAPCMGLRRDIGQVCMTLIAIPLDMGPSSFRCPICGTVYVVDPLKKGDPSGETGNGKMEVEGHLIEVFGSARVQRMTFDDLEYLRLVLSKVGSMERAFNAQVLSAPGEGLAIMKRLSGNP